MNKLSTSQVVAGSIVLALALFAGGYLLHGWVASKPTATAEKATMATAPDSTAQHWTCGMHPWIDLPKPGKCPICHMELVPRGSGEQSGNIVKIDPVIAQNIGVRTEPAVLGPVTRVVRTIGTVEYDETRVRDVTLKFEGWIQKLYVNSVGQSVTEGQPLLEIYSRELLNAQSEYVTIYKQVQAAKGMSPDRAQLDTALLDATRKHLEYLDVTPEQIAEIEKTRQAPKTLTIRSPFTGLVVIKDVNEGAKVDAAMRLFRIADLSKVWILATIYEYQVPFIEAGQRASISLPYVPGQTFEGKVAYIYPYVSTESRQVKVRLEFDNPGFFLKPGMFTNVELRRTLATERTLVPREAVIDTGTRQVAFISLGQGRFELRNVQVGVEADGGKLEILDGIKPGEMVVVSGEFLLDSEARLREASSKMSENNLIAGQNPTSPVAGASELATIPDSAAQSLGELLDAAFKIGGLLAGDNANDIAEPARLVAASVDELLKTDIPDAPHFWHQHTEAATLRGKALELVDAKDIDAARQAFADMSIALIKLVRATGVPPAYGKAVETLHCPMYREGQGGTWWLQPAGDVRNPYYGTAMLGCFDKRETLPVTGVKPPQAAKPDRMPSMPGM